MSIKKLLFQGGLLAFFFLSIVAIPATAQTPDPGIAGSLAVTKAEYNLGDAAYTLPTPASAITVEIRGSVHYPTGLAGGPYPVLVFLHGRHSTCYNYTTLGIALAWPCPSGDSPIVSYEGYDYLARNMASHGYIVISVSCNKINAVDNGLGDRGMQERAELVQHHLDLWNTWNTTGGGPFGSTFVGKLNMQNIGTMGHSRGGEGVIYHAIYNQSLGSPYGIKAVVTLAPVDFFRKIMHGIPLLDVSPYCDGDVSDLEGVHFYDDSRYSDTSDVAPKHTVLFMGANHNFFNTVWTPGSYIAGGTDDWLYSGGSTDAYCGALATGTGRFDSTKQKAGLTAYMAAFYRIYMGGETKFSPILDVKDIVPPASSTLDSTNVFVSYHPGKKHRLDVNRTDSLIRYSSNSLSGAVTESGLVAAGVCGGSTIAPDCGITTHADQKPHDEGFGPVGGLVQMSMQWNDTTQFYENDVPAAYQDFSTYDAVQFRASVNFYTSTPATALDFTVQLIDSAGAIGSQAVTARSHALFFQPGATYAETPKILLNTIQVPLSDFTGVNLNKIRKIIFLFNRSTAGAVVVSDLQVVNSACGKLKAAFTDTLVAGFKHRFTDSATINSGDTLTVGWNFGDPSSGASNTSTLTNPIHIFSGVGTFTVCHYIVSHRLSGLVCMDTICRNVVIPATVLGFQSQAVPEITIIPNPAKDYLQVSGAENTDVLTLVDLYGRTVFTATINQPTILLPKTLASGIYHAVINTATGRVYKKLLIAR